MKKKGLAPTFFPGRFYLAGCITCDGPKFTGFCNVLFRTLYPTEADQKEHVVLYSCKLADNHRYTFLSIPIGDMPLVQALIDTHLDSDFLDGYERQNNVFRLCFGSKINHPCMTGLELWNKRQYLECFQFLSAFYKVHPFCLFLSIRAQLVLNDRTLLPQTMSDAAEYMCYHRDVSGEESEQYGNALLLYALVQQKVGYTDLAKQDLLTALPRLRSLQGYGHYVLGALCKDANEAYRHLKLTDNHRFFGIALKYYNSDRLACACHFASKCFEDNPQDDKVVELMAKIHCRLENSHIARRMWSSLGLTVEQIDEEEKKLPESTERVCAKCGKPGNSIFFLRCPTCQDWWYCSQTCIEADAIDHRPFCQWCNRCGTLIPVGEREWCTGCFDVFYCGRQCQLQDWRQGEHKQDCTAKMKKKKK